MKNNVNIEAAIPDELGLHRLSRLAPRPRCPEDTGLSRELLTDLTAKHLLDRGAMTLGGLAQAMRLPGAVVESILTFMRGEALIEIRPSHSADTGLNYCLTDRGRSTALDAMLRSGYVGPAPVTIEHYSIVTRSQTIHKTKISQDAMRKAFRNIVIEPELLDRLGASVNSGRAIFLYGGAGTGKTFVSQRLAKLFPEAILLPHAVAIDNTVIQLFDPLVHEVLEEDGLDEAHMLERGHDRRFYICRRPAVVAAGELVADMLEVMYEPAAKLYQAPLQMRANNGVFIIDDLGRQRIEPKQLFNRWIVPLEEKKDYLTLNSGRHFSVPFDVVLILSANINPLELADEAFLRRIGYKIRFTPLSAEAYERVWRDTCVEYEIDYDQEVLDYVINELHGRKNVDLLPCHPRDLIGMAVDHAVYTHNQRFIDIDNLRWAWRNYFVSLDEGR